MGHLALGHAFTTLAVIAYAFSPCSAARDEDGASSSVRGIVGVETWSWSASGLAAQVSALLSSADTFLASADMRHHLAAAKRVRLVAGLERLGLPVELRFKRHLLRHLLRGAVNVPGQANHGGATRESFLQRQQLANSTEDEASPKSTMYDICDAANSDRFFKDVRAWYKPGSPHHAKHVAALNNYCAAGKFVEKQEHDLARGVDWSSLKRLDAISPAYRPETDEELAKYSTDDVEQKRQWRQRQAMVAMGWRDATHLAKGTPIVKVRNLYMQALAINQRVNRIVEKIREAMEMDWLELVKPKREMNALERATASVAGVAKWLGQYIGKIASNVQTFFMQVWHSLVRVFATSERECKTNEARIQEEKSANLLKPADRRDPASVDDFVKKVTKKKVSDLQEEATKLESVMDDVAEANAGTATTEVLEDEVDVVKRDQEQLEKAMTGAGDSDAQHPEEILEQMDAADRHAERVEADWCKVTSKQSVDGMHRAMDKVMRSVKEEEEEEEKKKKKRPAGGGGKKAETGERSAASKALEVSLPLLGFRGIGVAAIGLGGGFEEVVDFRNMEIGLFKWGSGAFGTSSTGASLGGYAGFGWKGYKENWTMEEGYQTAIFISHSLNLAITGLPVGFGMTFGTDADNSKPGPWIPEPHGINEVSFGWSASASLSNLVVPMSFDIGAAYFWLLHAECYGDIGELLKYIWLPSCRRNERRGRGGCFQGPESSNIEVLRAGIHAATPVIPDLAFTILASLYDSVRDPTYTRRCSDTSTNFRNNVTRFTLKAGQLIQQTVESLHGLEKDVAELGESLRAAMQTSDVVLERTRAFRDWRRSLEAEVGVCDRGPPDLYGRDTFQEGLRNMETEELVEMCGPLDLGGECAGDGARHRELIVQRLALATALRNADVDRDKLNTLSRALRDAKVTKGVKTAIQKLAETCEGSCATGEQVWRILAKLSQKELLTICGTIGAQCHRKKKAVRALGLGGWLNFFKKPYDVEMLAMIITKTFGLGQIDQASDANPFGVCTSDRHCPDTRSFCPVLEDMHEAEARRCQCDAQSCYTLDPDTGKGACVKPGSSVHQVLHTLRSQCGKYAVQTGFILGQLKSLGEE